MNTRVESIAAAGEPAAGAARPPGDGEGPALRRAHQRMAAVAAALLTAGFVLAVASLVGRTNENHLGVRASLTSHGTLSANDTNQGSLGQRIDRAIDVPYAPLVRRAQAALRYRLFGDLGAQVREGCPGWLFYEDGLSPAQSASAIDAAMTARIATLERYATALRRDGITLVVVTVPDKARIETEALCGLRQDAGMTQRLAQWQRALTQAGVAHVDLVQTLRAARPAFYRTDVHWNARGAQAAAQTVGATVLPLVGGRGALSFATERAGAPAPRIGDLLKLAGLDEVSDGWRPAPDSEVSETLRAQHTGGLLDEAPPAEVLLAGSSFSRRSAFAERLGQTLGRDVWNVSVDDGRFDRALAAEWARRASWPTSVRVVIWEMSEDALSEAQAPEQTQPAAPTEGKGRGDQGGGHGHAV